jgi:predicted HAD superfamily phosphohydrolase YqeG
MLAKAGYADARRIVSPPRQILITAVRPSYRKEPEKVSASQIARCLALPFRPDLTSTLMRLDRFEDLPVDRVKTLVRGLIIDVDGTLIKPGMDHIPADVIDKIRAIREKMPVCIFTDDQESFPEFEMLGIPVVRNVPPKTDPRSFDVAVQLYLQYRQRDASMLYPAQCAMVGDNFLTDGTCREIGMKFIHVQSLTGRESGVRTWTRNFANRVARFHDRFRRKKKAPPAASGRISLPRGQ